MTQVRQRRICVFTGSRADYGPFSALIRRLNADHEIEVRILVSGGHLVPEQGMTVHEIEGDNFTIDERIDMVLASDTPVAVAKSFGLACIGYADALERISPDLLLIAGDRYEAFAAAAAALLRLLPVAHIAGGQLTHGSIDDQIRHAISKLSHLHLTFTGEDRQRLIHMGEHPRRVHHIGTINIDPNVLRTLKDPVSLETILGITLHKPLFVITFHPATANPHESWHSARCLLDALKCFPESTQIITAPNVDHGSQWIHEALREYVEHRPNAIALLPSLGQAKYLSLVRHADLVIGNSSSGVMEAPLLHTPTVNVGDRQDGRPHPPSVIDCEASTHDIVAAIHEGLRVPESAFASTPTDQHIEHALNYAVEILRSTNLEELIPKKYFDTAVDILPTGAVL
ncbi:UDP-N-acetylglucosamine 2-epimerase [Phytoactinopolyspora endophytica]|uniref:UDP-N-acetylglucosamine 2-epimerase n=1 Tax=Phytoactinopolyspora endophytica TaxID=1642495 RepID=UPI0013ECE748|nr:UDP-N-acetylglucosamine 2-epimerase [Phytoactinopolyspora endophytica]